MADKNTPLKLSEEGAQLLSEVLARRDDAAAEEGSTENTATRHDTLIARAGAHRRTRDPLRSTRPPIVDSIDLAVDRAEEQDELARPPSTAVRVLLAGMVLGATVVVLAVWLVPRLSEPSVQVAGAVEESAGSSVAPSVIDPDVATTARSASGANDFVVVDPKSIEVAILDVDPTLNGVRSFALRLRAVGVTNAIATDEFSVIVEQADRTPVTTFSRFESDLLAVGSSALASVRAEGAGNEDLFVAVRLGDLEIDRIALG